MATVLRSSLPRLMSDKRGAEMPAKTEKQRKFMGAELSRKRKGMKTKTGMSMMELEEMASKSKKMMKKHNPSAPFGSGGVFPANGAIGVR